MDLPTKNEPTSGEIMVEAMSQNAFAIWSVVAIGPVKGQTTNYRNISGVGV
jgi:hypothetical protein